MRESPSRTLIEALWQSVAIVLAYYPVALEEAESIYGKHSGLTMCGDKYVALQGADVLVICTEWLQFRAPDFAEMASRIRSKVIVDRRNLYQPLKLRSEGWDYFSVECAAPSSATKHRMA